MKGLLYDYLYVIPWSLLFLLVIKKNIAVHCQNCFDYVIANFQ